MPTILSGLAACQKQGVCVCYLCDIPPSGPNPWHPPLPTHYTQISFLGQSFKTVCGLPH